MGYQIPDLCVYQGRWFSDDLTPDGVRFSQWKNIDEWEYLSMLEHIKQGAKYQVRILKQIDIQGYGVDETYEVPEISVNPGL